MAKLQVAYAVYSARDDAAKDFRGTMQKVKAMGYDGVELAGMYGLAPETIRDAIKEAGLTPISAHVPYQELKEDMEGTVDKYVTIGCPYIAIPYLTEEYRPGAAGFAEVVENIVKIGEICNKKGVVLLYHNHDFEFVKMEDGRYALDYLFETVSPALLQTEIDTCWVNVAGVDPAGYVRKYSGRSPIVHLKDFVGDKSENMYELIGIKKDAAKKPDVFEFRAVGYGKQDFPSIVKAAVEGGAKWVIVEQDMHYENTALEDARLSREYLKKLGI